MLSLSVCAVTQTKATVLIENNDAEADTGQENEEDVKLYYLSSPIITQCLDCVSWLEEQQNRYKVVSLSVATQPPDSV
jgi:hypothetical protein